ncbi:hydrogen peroxide-inducible genes activator [Nitratireductor indicus]|uniref:LysR family transcriptional regulator n=1 Tax=Nitratireductor indicus C115 TaxID=1231190 RepID=K2MXY8_9HYPH|nr:hydrogen peroxide-inducible genes activator [Nitratireductor indicus]EKF40083.1 LysR family transcriptional regulator [Nitratireductor indicus C115]MDS1138754.1 hydrogen peroxide-inducible genes activator [Nitratireductor indicus]SFQ81214.1 LysR family transcriptional regulator, hydrogen peroxide-inducible genes activator [Nitratireductor indicus]
MIRLTVKQMQYFERLAEMLHFGRAAASCGITQPALSAQISEMEAQLGVQLFERGRHVRLTSEARAMQPRIARILAELRDLEYEARQDRQALEGRFRLGVIPTVAPYLLPELLPRLKREFPLLQLEIREAVTGTLMQDTAGGLLDAMIAAEPIEEPRLIHEALFEDPFYLAVPEDEAERIAPPVAQESMALERLMLLEDGHCLRGQALEICGMVKPVTMESFGATSLTTLLHLVSHGMGVTLIPAMALPSAKLLPSVRILPFASPSPARILCLAWRKTNPRRSDFQILGKAIRQCLNDMMPTSILQDYNKNIK